MHRPRLALLRQATGAIHTDLERIVEREGFFSGRGPYGEYLRRLHLFYRRFEHRLEANMRDFVSCWQIGDRVTWLSQDLDALMLAPLACTSGRRTAPEPLTDPAVVFGALYVLLGASLGARVLIERTKGFCLPDHGGQTYLQRVGGEVQWRRFLERLESEPIASTDAMCKGAVDTFDCIRKHLARPDVQ